MDALLLDYNGVIVDDEPLHFETFKEVLAEEGVPLDEAGYYSDYLGLNDRAAFSAAFRRAGREVEPAFVAHLVERKAGRYASLAARGLRPVPGVQEFVRACAGRARLAVVSGALRSEISAGLARVGLHEMIEIVVSADDVPVTKPDPASYRTALSRLAAAHPDAGSWRALAVEDSPHGLAAARAAGAGCAVLTTSFPAGRLAGADAVWDDFEGRSPEELENLWREVAVG